MTWLLWNIIKFYKDILVPSICHLVALPLGCPFSLPLQLVGQFCQTWRYPTGKYRRSSFSLPLDNEVALWAVCFTDSASVWKVRGVMRRGRTASAGRKVGQLSVEKRRENNNLVLDTGNRSLQSLARKQGKNWRQAIRLSGPRNEEGNSTGYFGDWASCFQSCYLQ